MLIRRMDFNDVDQVNTIEQSGHLAPWTKKILSDCILVGYQCYVILPENSPVIRGYVIYRCKLTICHILNLCVAPHYQNQGFGKLLLEFLLTSLENTGVDCIHLEVRPSNTAAIKLYEGLGFIRDSIKKDYYNDEAGCEDALVLKKLL